MDDLVFIPNELLTDTRLDHRELRVMLALFSFRDRHTNPYWPNRNDLAERANVAVHELNGVVETLRPKGWIVRVPDGFRVSHPHV